jgi:hypothetical protein
MKLRMIPGLALLAAASFASAQVTINYSTGGHHAEGLGNTSGQLYDILDIVGPSQSVVLNYGTPTVAPLETVTFTAYFTFAGSGLFGPFSANRSFTAEGVTGTLSQAYTVTIGSSDTLDILAGSPTTLRICGVGRLTVTPGSLNMTVGLGPNGDPGVGVGTLNATFLLTAPTPGADLATLRAEVAAIPGLPAGANSLLAKLDAATASYGRGNHGAACGQLGAFINQVAALVATGRLTAAQGESLTESAHCICEDMEAGF